MEIEFFIQRFKTACVGGDEIRRAVRLLIMLMICCDLTSICASDALITASYIQTSSVTHYTLLQHLHLIISLSLFPLIIFISSFFISSFFISLFLSPCYFLVLPLFFTARSWGRVQHMLLV